MCALTVRERFYSSQIDLTSAVVGVSQVTKYIIAPKVTNQSPRIYRSSKEGPAKKFRTSTVT